MLGGDAAGPYGLHEAKPHGPRIPHIRFQEGRIEGKGQEKFPVVLEHSVGRRRERNRGGKGGFGTACVCFLKRKCASVAPGEGFPSASRSIFQMPFFSRFFLFPCFLQDVNKTVSDKNRMTSVQLAGLLVDRKGK